MGCSNLEIVRGGDVSGVTSLAYAFSDAPSLFVSGSGWDVSKVTDMAMTFFRNEQAPIVADWDVSAVERMSGTFYMTTYTPDVGAWDDLIGHYDDADVHELDGQSGCVAVGYLVSPVFPGCFTMHPMQTQRLGGWNVGSATTFFRLFDSARSANPDVSGWDTSSVTELTYMFANAESADPDVSAWDTSSVTMMDWVFRGAKVANPDVSGWSHVQCRAYGGHVLQRAACRAGRESVGYV